MASLKDLRDRIDSVKSTKKITSAMKLVAGARLKRARLAAESSRPYALRMQEVVENITDSIEDRESFPDIVKGKETDKVHLIVLMTSDRGLCGGFNSSLAKLAKKKIAELSNLNKTIKILCIGRKGHDQLKRDFLNLIIDTIFLSSHAKIDFEFAERVSSKIIGMYKNSEFDSSSIIYSLFKSPLKQEAHVKQIIPAINEEKKIEKSKDDNEKNLYDYEPDEKEVLENLIPNNISVQIYRGLLENAAGEQGARMTAMDSATRNAGELIDSLTLNYNRSRQAQITKELIEVISGAEAV